MKLKREGVPRHLGQQDILEGQLAFLQHVHLYEENHRGTHQPRLLWKYEFQKDPGGLRYEKKHMKREPRLLLPCLQREALLRERYPSAPRNPGQEDAEEARTSDQAADSSTPKRGSPQAEVPMLDEESLQKLIRENELKEEKKMQAAATESEGSTRYAYQHGDTVHGRVDATKAQQQEELNEIPRSARTNPLFKSGLLRRVDDAGMRMETPYGDPLVRITPFHSLPSNLKKV